MTAEIVDLGDWRAAAEAVEVPPWSSARGAVIDIALHLPNDTKLSEAAAWSDWLLAELWARGYEVVAVGGAA